MAAIDGVHGCMWAGITRLKAELGPGEQRQLDLKAIFTQVSSLLRCFRVVVDTDELILLSG